MQLTKYVLSPEAKQDLGLLLEYGLDSYMDHVALGYMRQILKKM